MKPMAFWITLELKIAEPSSETTELLNQGFCPLVTFKWRGVLESEYDAEEILKFKSCLVYPASNKRLSSI